MKKQVVALTTIALLSSTFGTSTLANTYQVQKGDTLTHIAKKYNTSVAQLKTLNNLSSDNIFIKQTLKVSASAKVVNPAPTTTVKPPVAKAPAAVTAPKPATPIVTSPVSYTVVKGDTLGKIANQYKISLADLMKWNNLDNFIIYPGQKLKVSANNGGQIQGEPVKVEPVQTEKPAGAISETIYTVQSGDTLGHISKKVGMSIEELKSANALSSDKIYVGQKLKVIGKANNVEVTPEGIDSEDVELLINQAKTLMNIPYVWGGSTLSGFDCSGFIYYVFNAAGKEINRLSTDGFYSRSYYVDSPQIGDLVFFENTYKAGISHMGIYLGNNEFIHASSSKGVMISSLNEAYYKERFDGFKRFY